MSNGNGWMPLYIGDYLGDTMELDAAQHGAYLLLLMYYWRNGPLPLDDAKLAQIARTDLRVWKKTVGPVVKAFFRERDGRLHQKRADAEIAKAAECHQRAVEKRQVDNDRLKSWRAKQGQDDRHPPEKANGKDPPTKTNETRFTGVSPPVSERVAKRAGNADETRLTRTSQVQPEREEERVLINKNSFSEETRARAERLPDGLEALLTAAGVTPPEPEPLADPERVVALVRGTKRALEMRIPYGETRSVEAQLDAIKAQPAAVGSEASMGLLWQPAAPVRTPAQQFAELTGCSLAEAEARFAA